MITEIQASVLDESRMEEWTFENADISGAVMHRAKIC